jgi:hypothetical protein
LVFFDHAQICAISRLRLIRCCHFRNKKRLLREQRLLSHNGPSMHCKLVCNLPGAPSLPNPVG